MSKKKQYKEYLLAEFVKVVYILHITNQSDKDIGYDDYYYYNKKGEFVRVLQPESYYKMENIITRIKSSFDTLEEAKDAILITKNMEKYNL